jgi:diketogulonate reductase-like aldo/keto reductase
MYTRRSIVKRLAGFSALTLAGIPGLGPVFESLAADSPENGTGPIMRPIPSTGRTIPAIGMGTWVTFNVGDDARLRDHRARIMRVFFQRGGSLIDSSPMYGSSARVVGHGLKTLDADHEVFSASKVWTRITGDGREQMDRQRKAWGLAAFDLMQVHNLVDWERHMDTLRRDKAQGRIGYIGVTTSHGRRHEELERVMRTQPLDFVQFSYNIGNRRAEERLLPLAAEKGIAVIANRPFMHRELFRRWGGHPLPDWAGEFDAGNWAQFFLKFIIADERVTCAIPATSQIPHMRENMGALYGRLPDAGMRARMVNHVESL